MKKFFIPLFLVFISFQALKSQAFVRAGIVAFDLNLSDKEELYQIKMHPRYYVGGGLEAKILKIFLLEIGANYYKLDLDLDSLGGQVNGSILGLPVLLKINPSKYFNAGVGLMPSIFLNQGTLEDIYYKKYDLSGTAKIEVKPIKQISIELVYTVGFIPKDAIHYRDPGGLGTLVNSRSSFYNLGIKYNF